MTESDSYKNRFTYRMGLFMFVLLTHALTIVMVLNVPIHSLFKSFHLMMPIAGLSVAWFPQISILLPVALLFFSAGFSSTVIVFMAILKIFDASYISPLLLSDNDSGHRQELSKGLLLFTNLMLVQLVTGLFCLCYRNQMLDDRKKSESPFVLSSSEKSSYKSHYESFLESNSPVASTTNSLCASCSKSKPKTSSSRTSISSSNNSRQRKELQQMHYSDIRESLITRSSFLKPPTVPREARKPTYSSRIQKNSSQVSSKQIAYLV